MSAILDSWIKSHQQKDLLRFLTCGSVDDGKSTLIGRLLYDTDLVPEDQLAAVAKDSERHGTTGKGQIDLALLTDGLKAEREQGITIDVAYRYFSTERRKFIIADCPGHAQYTRNMATGASNCQLAIILVDARHGVMEQTRRHAFIVGLLGIRHVVVAVNKMDLAGWSQEVFERIRSDFTGFASRLDLPDIHFIPVSALTGDNVVTRGGGAPWYNGSTLLEYLETVHIASDRNLVDFRMPVQLALRPNLDFRGFAGTIVSGAVKVGDEVINLPSRRRSRVTGITVAGRSEQSAFAPQAALITLADEIDCSRGDMLAHPGNVPRLITRAEAMLVWMREEPLDVGRRFWIRGPGGYVPGRVAEVRYVVDVNTLHRKPGEQPGLNAIARVAIEWSKPVPVDPYARNRATGSFVLVDREDNSTAAAGMVLAIEAEQGAAAADPAERRRRLLGHRGVVLAAGSRERAAAVCAALLDRGIAAIVVDDGFAGLAATAQPALAAALAEQGQVVVLAGGAGAGSIDLASEADPAAAALRAVQPG